MTKKNSNTDLKNDKKRKRVLIIGALPEVLRKVVDEVRELRLDVEGTTGTKQAAVEFDPKHFDLIVFGSGVVGPISKRLRMEFSDRDPDVKFLDAFAPVALKQIDLALSNKPKKQQYLKKFKVIDDGHSDYILQANILKSCNVRIEVYKTKKQGAPDTHIVPIMETNVEPGLFECRIDSKHRLHGHMIYMNINDDEFCLYNMHE